MLIHGNSKAYQQAHVAAVDAVRQVVTQLESETEHVFPDYHYFKLKALDENEPDFKLMPKRIAPNFMICSQ